MSACARCGLPKEGGLGTCFGGLGSDIGDLACRDRELSNLRSLLRSVTGKLEEAAEFIQEDMSESALLRINNVLEVLS